MSVFAGLLDRWGHIVFATEDPAFQRIGSYDGGGEYSGYFVQNNMYTYRLSFRWGSEEAQSVNVESRVGWVSVMR